ncbi:MAG: pyridoxal-phosphate dependent enzyme [Deltaproteobacteria bacterium]|nr:pyridoxal-phosphate dependent enzyme [Deltaproteobacteria bacterium]
MTSLPELASELGAASFHVKRDDLSAEPYGGGKARKLELLLGQAVADGRSQVVTFGGMGSHHAAATAIYGRQLGLQVHLFLLPQPRTDEVCRVVLTCQAQGATLHLAGSLPGAQRKAARLAATSPGDYQILPAGGTAPLGNVGFINAALELASQVEAGELPAPDELFIALGTMGSAVGLAIGLSVAELDTTIVAVRASSHRAASWRKLAALHRETVVWLRSFDPSFPDVGLDPARLRIEDRYLGRGYSLPTTRGQAATQIAAQHGLRLDSTYTAKAFAALLAAAGDQSKGKGLLFWHTHSARRLEPEGADLGAVPAAIRGYASCPTGR